MRIFNAKIFWWQIANQGKILREVGLRQDARGLAMLSGYKIWTWRCKVFLQRLSWAKGMPPGG